MEQYKVTQIKQNKKRLDYADVFINEVYFATISKNLIIEYAIFVSKSLSVEDVHNIEQANDFDKNLQKAMNFISIRPRSERELRSYLIRKKIDQTQVASIITQLKEKGFVNDLDFAKWWIDNRLNFTNKTRAEIYYELSKKGIARGLVDNVFKDYVGVYDEKSSVEEVFLKKMGYNNKVGGITLVEGQKIDIDFERKMKILNFLRSKGFNSESIDYIRKKYF